MVTVLDDIGTSGPGWAASELEYSIGVCVCAVLGQQWWMNARGQMEKTASAWLQIMGPLEAT